MATRVGTAATKVAKPLAAKLTKGANAVKHAGSRITQSTTRLATKIAKPRNVEKFNRFIQRTKQAAKIEFKDELRQQVNQYIENYVEKYYPGLAPYLGDIQRLLQRARIGSNRRAIKSLGEAKAWLKDRVRGLAEEKVNQTVDNFVAQNFPQLNSAPYMDAIKSLLKPATRGSDLIEQVKEACRTIVTELESDSDPISFRTKFTAFTDDDYLISFADNDCEKQLSKKQTKKYARMFPREYGAVRIWANRRVNADNFLKGVGRRWKKRAQRRVAYAEKKA